MTKVYRVTGQSLAEFPILAMTVLYFLIPSLILSQTIVPGGFVSGNWTEAGSPYLVHDDLLVHPDSTLEIGAGVQVLFTGPYLLEVQGQILVSGSPGAHVVFDRSSDTVTWRGIYLNTTDTSITDSSKLTYCHVSHCNQNGGLRLSYASRTRVSHARITHCVAFRGAGINCEVSGALIEYTLVDSCLALDGGGISLQYSDARLKNCTITGNHADGAGGGMVIFDLSQPHLDSCIIENNYSYGSGGGVYINNSSPVFERCTFQDNSGAIGGGNLYSGGAVSVKTGCAPRFIHCTFTGNLSNSMGGGIASFSSMRTINCLFKDNYADSLGGGLYVASSSNPQSHVYNCTFIDNESPSGSALATYYHTAVLKNAILWHSDPVNPASLIYLDAAITAFVLDAEFSVIRNGESGIERTPKGKYNWGEGNIDADPVFEAGGYGLSWQSPCIEAGTPDTTGLGLPETDLGGMPRIVNARIDMGAYEYQAPVAVQRSKFKVQSGFTVYPNPATDLVVIEMVDFLPKSRVALINSEGSIVCEAEMSSRRIMLNTKSLPAGLYMVRLTGDDPRDVISNTLKLIIH